MNQPLRVLVNGVQTDRLSALDRGLHYGDGVFRTLRVSQGQPVDGARHLSRLYADARRLGVVPPDIAILSKEIAQLCGDQVCALLKIILTRGISDRGYQFDATSPGRVLLLYSMPQYPAVHWDNGIQMRICEIRLAQNPKLAGIKHLNRLEQVLARAEWDDPGIMEGLMLDTDERLIEGVASNLFLVSGGKLMTPDLVRCGVAGVTREMILEAAPAYTRAVQVQDIRVDALLAADECFVCNSVIGVWPVTRLDDQQWEVGPVTRKIQQHLGRPCLHAT